MIDEINLQAKKIFTLKDVVEMAKNLQIKETIVKVGYNRECDQLDDLRRYFMGKGLDPVKTAVNRLNVDGIEIIVVSCARRRWVDKIRGFKNFIKP